MLEGEGIWGCRKEGEIILKNNAKMRQFPLTTISFFQETPTSEFQFRSISPDWNGELELTPSLLLHLGLQHVINLVRTVISEKVGNSTVAGLGQVRECLWSSREWGGGGQTIEMKRVVAMPSGELL